MEEFQAELVGRACNDLAASSMHCLSRGPTGTSSLMFLACKEKLLEVTVVRRHGAAGKAWLWRPRAHAIAPQYASTSNTGLGLGVSG